MTLLVSLKCNELNKSDLIKQRQLSSVFVGIIIMVVEISEDVTRSIQYMEYIECRINS